MKKGYTHIAVVLDRSGSMESIKSDTIGGFNTFLKGQKEAEGRATLTLAQFDDRYDIVYNSVDVKEVKKLDNRSFVPRGSTALYDAICRTIDKVGLELHELRESQRPEKVIFVIVTDGGENASREFTLADVNDRIAEQRDKYSWEFVFLAANQDAMAVGSSLGVGAANSMTYGLGADSVSNVYSVLSKKMVNYRSGLESNMSYSTVEREEQEELNK